MRRSPAPLASASPARRFAAVLALLAGCASGSGDGEGKVGEGADGASAPPDARFLTDVYTWTCRSTVDDSVYQGVYGQSLSLEYAPGAVTSLDLPPAGDCQGDLDMRPRSAGDGGLDIPGLGDSPRWESDTEAGVMDRQGRGYYRDEVFPGERTCLDIEEVLGQGALLTEAGVLTGVRAPVPAGVPAVDYGDLEGRSISFGDELTVSWDDQDWDQSWIQLAREKEGVAFESATCNTTGMTSFTLGAGAWGLLTEELEVQQNALYIGFQRSERTTLDGTEVVAITRAVAVAAVAE